MRLITTISDFLAWWFDELSGMFPTLAKRFTKPAQAKLLVGTEGSTFPVFLEKADQEDGFGADTLENLDAFLSDAFDRKRGSLEILLGRGHFIERKLADIRLPVSRAAMMVDVDINANTPFNAKDVFVAFPEQGPRRSGTSYFIFRKKDLQRLLQTIRFAGLEVTSIGVENGETGTRLRQRDLKHMTGATYADRTAKWMGIAIVAVLAVGIVGTWYLDVRRLGEAERILTTRVEDARSQAGRIRVQYDARMQLLDQMASIRKEKNLTNSAVYLWEQLSRTLPDDSWLTDMKIADGVLTVSGYSQSAASLISLIEDADGFSNPEFKSAVVKAPNVDAERFTLQAFIDGQHP